MGFLYYDKISDWCHFVDGTGEHHFLGDSIGTLLSLQSKFGFTESQAREGFLQARFNGGDAVDMEVISKIAARYITKEL